jgi:hypothetical protein
MGRYYSGDIEGKFWFGVQPSDAGERFGARRQEPVYVSYYLDKDMLPTVQEELKAIEDKLGEAIPKLTKHFDEKGSYNDKEMCELLGLDENEQGSLASIISDFADWELGKKIEACLIENGECSFEAEL